MPSRVTQRYVGRCVVSWLSYRDFDYDLPLLHSQVIEIDPSNSHAYHNRGISYDKLGQFERAIADFSKGEHMVVYFSDRVVVRGCRFLSIVVPYISARHCLFSSLSLLVCRNVNIPVLELDAHNANAYFNRGSTHDSLGSYDKAIADYTRALELDREIAASGSYPAGASSIGTVAMAAVKAVQSRKIHGVPPGRR